MHTENILIIRLSAMGDVAMTIPVIRAFRHQYPYVKLTILTRKIFFPFFEGIPNLQCITADVRNKHKGVLGLYRLFNELMPYQITAVADLHQVLRSRFLVTLYKAKGTVVQKIDKGRSEKKRLLNQNTIADTYLRSTHQRYADVFSKLGYDFSLDLVTYSEKKKLPRSIREQFGQSHKKWIGIAPFAQHEGKTYPWELMQQLIQILHAKDLYEIILFGGGKQQSEIAEKESQQHENVYNAIGKLTLSDELAWISNLDLMVSMDSANGHIAAMFGVSVLTIWGTTHPCLGFAPFGQPKENAIFPDLESFPLIPTSVYGNKIPKNYMRAMYSITPDQIAASIVKLLGKESSKNNLEQI